MNTWHIRATLFLYLSTCYIMLLFVQTLTIQSLLIKLCDEAMSNNCLIILPSSRVRWSTNNVEDDGRGELATKAILCSIVGSWLRLGRAPITLLVCWLFQRTCVFHHRARPRTRRLAGKNLSIRQASKTTQDGPMKGCEKSFLYLWYPHFGHYIPLQPYNNNKHFLLFNFKKYACSEAVKYITNKG